MEPKIFLSGFPQKMFADPCPRQNADGNKGKIYAIFQKT